MSRPMRYFLLALLVAPFAAYYVHRIAKGLGFLDPPWNREHEYRRTIVVAIYAFLLFLPVFLFGYSLAWPRVWAIFGLINGLALVIFAAFGFVAGRRLWRLRHPLPESPAVAPTSPETGEDAAGKPLV